MMSILSSIQPLPGFRTGARYRYSVVPAMVVAMVLGTAYPAVAQEATSPQTPTNTSNTYTMHQSIELGGHIADHSGSAAVYGTMVNLHSGPRVLGQSLDLRAVDPKHAIFFDHLSTNSFGFGGDPNNVFFLNMEKGRIYDFRGSFRRSRQYFDYDLLANPLIPPTSNPDVPILSSPHLFNTVRHMTDLNLTLGPLSLLSLRLSYNRNTSEGPSYSSVHYGADALLAQDWSNKTDVLTGGIDWKILPKTSLSYDQFLTFYKGETTYGLADLNYQLSDGTPVSSGIDFSSVWSAPCAAPITKSGAYNPKCNGYLSLSRIAPIHTSIPTEQLRFQSSSIPHVTLNGRMLYSSGSSKLLNFNETFNGLQSRGTLRESIMTGLASTRRVNTTGDLGATWQIASKIAASDVFDFNYFRTPGTNAFTTTSFAGSSMLVAPGDASVATSADYQFLGQKTKANTFIVAWDAVPRARFSLGHRYRNREIKNAGGDDIKIHENWGIFGATLQPATQWRVNFNADVMYADNAYTRISPRHLQHYRLRTTYKPQQWLTFSGAVNMFESSDNVQYVNHKDHNREFSFATDIAPSDRWSVDLSYGYSSIYSTTLECYIANPAPPGAGTSTDQNCIDNGTPLTSPGYYNVPSQFGSIGFTASPVKRVHATAGFRMTSIDGNTDTINARQVPGSIQSQYETPYGSLAFDMEHSWTWNADYNYYSYGEGSPIGPTAPRSFRGNVYTLGVRYAF